VEVISQEIARNALISITMGCMEDECPAALTPYREDWDLEDPKGGSIEKFRKVRDEIISRVDKLVEDIKNGRFY
jgi:protein-tyrosine-phosphatase